MFWGKRLIPRKISDRSYKISVGNSKLYELMRFNIRRKKALKITSLMIAPEKAVERPADPRNEHIYYVVDGVGKIEFPDSEEKSFYIEPYSLIYIPYAIKHRIVNEGSSLLHLLDIVLVEF